MNWSKLAAVVITVVTVATWLWTIILRDLTQRYTRNERPGQFNGQLDADLLDDYGLVFVIAHNAGDDAETAQAALEHSADAVEIDVIMVGGRLYAAHATPPKLIGAWLFRGPRLEDAWEIVANADAVALDLKDDSADYEDALVAFLDARPNEQVVLSSRNIDSLMRLKVRLPRAHMYLSVPNREQFDRLVVTHALAPQLDGVSMHHRFVDSEVMAVLKARDQRIIVWTVNDLTRVNELVRLGVDGITTDNLAILNLLGGRDRPEPLLRQRSA
ncbi:MAG TPA: glycerophosphodiester phosphodiesterase [Thermomicrobiales bacterium]|nr:glycerophosphodiester phosphodiesterase [Thermomicrobiales bacterium]